MLDRAKKKTPPWLANLFGFELPGKRLGVFTWNGLQGILEPLPNKFPKPPRILHEIGVQELGKKYI
jgi:hypothetical protein